MAILIKIQYIYDTGVIFIIIELGPNVGKFLEADLLFYLESIDDGIPHAIREAMCDMQNDMIEHIEKIICDRLSTLKVKIMIQCW